MSPHRAAPKPPGPSGSVVRRFQQIAISPGGPRLLAALWLMALLLVACARQEREAPPARGGAVSGEFALLSMSPADGTRQVPRDARVTLHFDRAIDAEAQLEDAVALYDLSAASPLRVAARLVRGSDVRELVLVPTKALSAATEYELRVSALVCDRGGLILDRSARARWRSEDLRAPRLAAARALGDGRVRLDFDETTQLDARALIARSAHGRLTLRVEALSNRSFDVIVTQLDAEPEIELTLPKASVRDLDGNANDSPIVRRIEWPRDDDGPRLVDHVPAETIAANAWLVLRFDRPLRSVDTSQRFEELWTTDRRRLALRPRGGWSHGAQRIVLERLVDRVGQARGPIAIQAQAIAARAPLRVLATWPARPDRQGGQRARHPIGTRCELAFDRMIDARSLDEDAAHWHDAHGCALGVTRRLDKDHKTLVLEPQRDAEATRPAREVPGAQRVELAAAPFGPLDELGIGLAEAVTIDFESSARDKATSFARLLARLPDRDGPHPPSLQPVLVFDRRVSIPQPNAVALLRGEASIPHRVEVLDAARDDIEDASALRIVPLAALEPGSYELRLRAGLAGFVTRDGARLDEEITQSLSIASSSKPIAKLGIEGVSSRRAVLGARDAHVSVDCGATALDPWRSSLTWIDARGKASLAGAALWRSVALRGSNAAKGPEWTAIRIVGLSGQVHCSLAGIDLAGRPLTGQVSFDVDAGFGQRAFSRTQLVRVTFDEDRDANGHEDFAEDLVHFGLVSAQLRGSLRRAWVESIQSAIVEIAHRTLGRDADGERGELACALRLTKRDPGKALHGSVSIGGLDPRGAPGRGLDAPSSGVLGRARFDSRNLTSDEVLTGEHGVFVRELLLWQLDNQRRLGRSVRTPFARRFAPICRALGGLPVGSNRHDVRILSPGFDYDRASPAQRARFETLVAAREDFAHAVAHILAHELGHVVGLVAEGPPQGGHDGNAAWHVRRAEALDLMASASTWLQLVDPALRFRPLSGAWLRNRILLR